MALSNHERIGKALDLLNAGLRPFVERELQAAYSKDWLACSIPTPQPERSPRNPAWTFTRCSV
jgi:hypothetical protein